MESDENDVNNDDEVSVRSVRSARSKSNENIETERDAYDIDYTNEDVTLNDVTEKLPSESNNIEENVELDELNFSQPSEKSDEEPFMTHRSNIEELTEEIDKENLYKLECDPCYLPGDFPSLPDNFDAEEWPISYRENSVKEELCLEFIDNFIRQYRHLYGDRRPLFIKPLNECNVPKMVCTTINVTKLPFPAVYYWEGAATFVADYLTMVPIVPCTDIPRRLLSSSTTLALQRGTSFEYASLLCSLLVGVGYNAYVVSGYATREVCFMDDSRTICPLLTTVDTHTDEREVRVNKRYSVRPPKDLTSKFEAQQASKRQKIDDDRLKRIEDEIKEEERREEQPLNDPLYGQRVHAWVLVLAGKREVGESFFIEALTGKACSVTNADYLGIESVWNNKNYWVNMQVALGGLANINYDLNNTSLWEYVFAGQESVVIGPPIVPAADYDVTEPEEEQINNGGDRYFDLPKSWTKNIVISLRQFEERCTDGRKEVLYKKARLEKYSQSATIDGIVTRVRRYEDRMLHNQTEVIESYQHRRDKLVKRVTDSNTDIVSEYFDKGRLSRLAEHHFHNDKSSKNHIRIMKFYHEARADCLMEIEDSEKKLVIKYQGRDDFLNERIVTFREREKKFGPANEREYQRPIDTIVEHYSRNRAVEAQKDIREVIFQLAEFRILVSFHTADGNIVGDMVEFLKSVSTGDSRRGSVIKLGKDACTYFQVDPYKPKLTGVETYENYLYLLGKEESSKMEIRKNENEMYEILKQREEENIANQMDISLYDRVRNVEAKTNRIDMERMIEEDKYRVKDEELDFLEPFLLQLDIGKEDEISKDQALRLHHKCLHDFKQRLINKANLLQGRFEKETEKLQEKQQWYQSNQAMMQKTDEQEYLQFCNEVTFKINTLEKMLARHKQTSKFKEMELDQRLRNDKRLAKHLIIK